MTMSVPRWMGCWNSARSQKERTGLDWTSRKHFGLAKLPLVNWSLGEEAERAGVPSYCQPHVSGYWSPLAESAQQSR